MQYLVTGAEMSLYDRHTSEHYGVPSVVLMEQAAEAFVTKLLEIHPSPRRVLVVCGSGNNGGDGIAIARLLNQRGIYALVYAPRRQHMSELFRLQWEIYQRYGYPAAKFSKVDGGVEAGEFFSSGHSERSVEELEVGGREVQTEGLVGGREVPKSGSRAMSEKWHETGVWDVVVDAIFGTGLSREVTSPFDNVIKELNRMDTHRIAVDIASGIASEDGRVLGTAFCAADTITFSFGKIGSFLWPGAAYSGRVHVVPIGITEESFLESPPGTVAMTGEDLALLPNRQPNSHKGTYGRLLIIAGSRAMAGAAVLSGTAAYRTGCGLVKIMTPEENRAVILGRLPEAILSLYDDQVTEQQVRDELEWADAVVMGPGIGTGDAARKIVSIVCRHRKGPIVLDADALNLLAESPELLELCGINTGNLIVTPHLGEMQRLTGEPVSQIKTHLIAAARSFTRRYGCVTVLKDSRTVTAIPGAEGRTYVNLSGNNGMATAGSGDVLAGIIGGLLAQGLAVSCAAPLGVYLHGLAGDAARDRLGEAGMLAGDIAEEIVTIQSGLRIHCDTELVL